jgi:CheY-specific phosphatase CheX
MLDAQVFSNNQLPQQLTDCVKQAVDSTFAMICGDDLKYIGCNGVVEASESVNGVIGIISLVGDVTWSLVVGLPKETACAMAVKFAGFEIPYDSDDMGDVVAELANVLAGDVSARLDEVGVTASMSLPTAIRGSDVDMMAGGAASRYMHYSSLEGPFYVKVVSAEPKQLRRSGE